MESQSPFLLSSLVSSPGALMRFLIQPLRDSGVKRGRGYRPEIDGLRALAVLAVIVNHVNGAVMRQGFLGVDIFFVISGYVVTSSLLAHQSESALAFLSDFYGRRFKRILPALIAMILLVALLFCLVIFPGEDLLSPSMRTGIAALFGVSNLYLLRQGADYFAADTSFNPFLHTWSLGVEEQFYFVWPLLLLGCGFGRAGGDRLNLRRLTLLTLVLFAVSLAAYLGFTWRGQADHAFYLMPSRFWELALGCLAYLLHRRVGRGRDFGKHLRFVRHRSGIATGLVLIMALLLLLPLPFQVLSNLIITFLTALVLVLLQPGTGVAASALGHPAVVGVGLLSYSLYLWHWPLIVLARWTVGVNRYTVMPILLATSIAALLSYRLETVFRYGHGWLPWLSRPLLFFPILSLMSAGILAGLQGPMRGWLYAGNRQEGVGGLSNSKRVDNTSISTSNCFREPTSSVPQDSNFKLCRAQPNTGRPTLYFEGDSHTNSLIPIGSPLLRDGSYNVAFFARGGCPSPYFEPRAIAMSAAGKVRYRLCAPHYASRMKFILADLKQGDRVVFVSNLYGYFGPPQTPSAFRKAVKDIDSQIRSKGARLVLFAPLPSFDTSEISVPLSLCRPEWFRPAWSIPVDCRPSLESRAKEVQKTEPVRALLGELSRESSSIDIYDPFPVICPPSVAMCSMKMDGQFLFSDGSHLTNTGALKLYPSFRSFLVRSEAKSLVTASPALSPSSP
jgi:hypothetical protein